MIRQRTICFVAGFSAGHILPALTLARKMLQEDPSVQIIFFSTQSAIDGQLLTQTQPGITHIPLPLQAVPPQWWRRPIWLVQACRVMLKVLWWLLRNNPEKIISTGGIIAVPVCSAALLARIPFDLYELNAVAGKAVLFLAPCAQTIFFTMPHVQTQLQHYVCKPAAYPLRYTAEDKLSSQQARSQLGMPADGFILLVVGGSQGSQWINQAVQQYIDRSCLNNKQPLYVIHQTGERDKQKVQDWYHRKNIASTVFSYCSDMALYYNAADCVIARAGAGTLFELQFFAKSSIIIPLETLTNDHQVENAYAMASLSPHLFKILRQQEITNDSHLFDATIYALGHAAGFPPTTE